MTSTGEFVIGRIDQRAALDLESLRNVMNQVLPTRMVSIGG